MKTCLLHDGAALKLKFMQGIRITDDQDIFLPTFKYVLLSSMDSFQWNLIHVNRFSLSFFYDLIENV